MNVHAESKSWPHLFVRSRRCGWWARERPKLVLEVDHVEGKVSNELMVLPSAQL